jgi:hypothetical protein
MGSGRPLECCFPKFLMCVLAPVRIFFVVCFLGVTSNSVCGAVPVRSALDHLRICSEISEFCDGFKLGIAKQVPLIALLARDADARRIVRARFGSKGQIIPGCRQASLVTPKSKLARFAECGLGKPATAGRPPFRSDCASQNFSIIVTKKRSTRFYEIQGPVCVDGLVLRRS